MAIVMWGHTTAPWFVPYPPFPAGWFGVEIFFALSGYLITRSLLTDPGPGALARFWIRRFCRIVPAFAVLAVASLFAFELAHPLALLTYTLNYAMAFGGRSHDSIVIGHVWSLCVEEHFYLFWPPFVIGLARRRLVAMAAALAALSYVLVAAFASWTAAQGLDLSWTNDAIQLLTPFRIGTLLLGAIPAILGVSFGDKRMYVPGSLLLLLGWVVPAGSASWRQPATLLSESLLATGLFYVVLAGLARPLLAWRPLAKLGQISYGVYLSHVPILYLFAVWGVPFLVGPDATHRVLPAYATVLLLSLLSYRYFESPIIRWGRGRAAQRT